MLKLCISNLRKIAPLGPSKGAQPHPFHGKFPTRIAIDVRWGRRPDQRWQYLGVPNIYAIHALNKRMRLHGAAAKYWEFDRKGQLIYAHCQPNANRLRVQNHNTTLIAVYHYWNLVTDPFLGFSAPFWMKKVQGRWIYSPFEHLKLDTHLRPYKTWLAEALRPSKSISSLKFTRYEHPIYGPVDGHMAEVQNNLAEPRFPDEGIQLVPNNPAELRAQVMDEARRAHDNHLRDLLLRAREERFREL